MSRPKLPNKVRIGYRTLSIVETDAIQLDESDGVMGTVSVQDGLIEIGTGQDDVERVNTLVHEIAHVFFRMAGMDDHAEEEQIVTFVANGMTELFIRNPELIRFIQRSVKAHE